MNKSKSVYIASSIRGDIRQELIDLCESSTTKYNIVNKVDKNTDYHVIYKFKYKYEVTPNNWKKNLIKIQDFVYQIETPLQKEIKSKDDLIFIYECSGSADTDAQLLGKKLITQLYGKYKEFTKLIYFVRYPRQVGALLNDDGFMYHYKQDYGALSTIIFDYYEQFQYSKSLVHNFVYYCRLFILNCAYKGTDTTILNNKAFFIKRHLSKINDIKSQIEKSDLLKEEIGAIIFIIDKCLERSHSDSIDN